MKWTKSDSINVKRAIALAVKYDAKDVVKANWKIYFKLIDPMMSEEAEYMIKYLGPFAIGNGLLYRFPEEVLAACEKWASSSNVNVRWNAAIIFADAAARPFASRAKSVLNLLENDCDPRVLRAVKKAKKQILSGSTQCAAERRRLNHEEIDL